MDLRDLAYFETVAELGHLGKAAERLNRSQPALTKSIQRLEASFGTRLFQRDGRRIKLTPVGELLLERGRALRRSIAETQREVRDFASGAVGNIRLGCAATMAEHLLPELTTALLQRAPQVTMKLVIAQDDQLRESLRSGELDMIISPMGGEGDEFDSHWVLTDEAVVIASHNHPIFDAPFVMADLCRYGWVLPPRSTSSRQWLDAAFVEQGLPVPRVQIEANSISLLPRLIARSNLLSLIARETLASGGNLYLREVLLAETTLQRRIGLMLRRGGYLSPAAQAMVELLREDGGRFLSAW